MLRRPVQCHELLPCGVFQAAPNDSLLRVIYTVNARFHIPLVVCGLVCLTFTSPVPSVARPQQTAVGQWMLVEIFDDASGVPVKDARIKIESPPDFSDVPEVSTDAAGRVQLGMDPASVYQIGIRKDGFEPKSITVDLHGQPS